MNAFAGIVRFDSDPSDGRIEERVCRAVAAPKNERVDVVRSEGALFVQRDVALAGQSKLAIPAATRHRLFVASARLDTERSWRRSCSYPFLKPARYPTQRFCCACGNAGVIRGSRAASAPSPSPNGTLVPVV